MIINLRSHCYKLFICICRTRESILLKCLNACLIPPKAPVFYVCHSAYFGILALFPRTNTGGNSSDIKPE